MREQDLPETYEMLFPWAQPRAGIKAKGFREELCEQIVRPQADNE